jgi:membrane-bound lytic murein transglycosylase F
MGKHFKGFALITIILLFIGCNSTRQKNIRGYGVDRDLPEIKEDGVLRALVVYSSTSYFLYRGQPLGFEYELLERLASYLDLELDIVISKNLSEQFEMLNKGEVDLIAHGITITNDRREEVDFTNYLYLVKQVLVQKKPDNWRQMSWASTQKQIIHDPIELIDDTVSVRENSSYFDRIKNLADEIGGKIVIDTLAGDLSTDEIIKMVVDGDIKYTVADDNLAKINASYYPILNIDVPISFSQRVGWAVRKDSPNLLKAINGWIKFEREKVDYYVIYNKYFKNKKSFKRRIESDYFSLNENSISAYDEIIIEHAEKIGWDWRLLASQIYQESRFDPKAKSLGGAK